MKLSFDWLSDFVSWKEKNPECIAEHLTACTAEVEYIERQGGLLEHCVVGRVLTIKRHPNADKLVLADVQTDKGIKHVVCGGINLREGMHAAFAHVGARVRWHGEELTTIEKTKIRGKQSEGMICSAEEIDLQTEFPDATGKNIIDLGTKNQKPTTNNLCVGQPLKDFLGINDTIFHIDNHAITHRPDLFSHVGFARECVAVGIAHWKKLGEKKKPSFTKESSLTCNVDVKDAVPRYLASTVTIDNTGETPRWMQRRLQAVGFRSLSLPIDITNYVTAEVGMPLHSFDADSIRGTVHFRAAKEGEKIKTLDGMERSLPKGAIVLSDDEGIFDLMGIMGGERSGTTAKTRHIYLHSAIVDPTSIRKTILATGLRTEAATIYEKGIPPVSASMGFFRALELFKELVPGARLNSRLESWGNDGKTKALPLLLTDITKVLGVTIPEKTTRKIFTALGFEMKRQTKNGKRKTMTVTPPLWRPDIHASHDLIEEIGRIYGFNRIGPVVPSGSISPPKRDARASRIRNALKEEGYIELLPFSFTGEALLKHAGFDPSSAITIQNPLSEDMALLQPCVLPRLLEHAEKNYVHASTTLRTFTIAHIFNEKVEKRELGMLFIRKGEPKLIENPLLEIKADLLAVLRGVGYTPGIQQQYSAPYIHPGRSGMLTVEHKTVGMVFELHPSVCEAFDLPSGATSAALCNLTMLLTLPFQDSFAKPLPQFPAVSYDLTIPWSHRKSVHNLLVSIQHASALLEDVHVLNLFKEDRTEKLRYNLTIRFTYRTADRTLREEEAQVEHGKILHLIKEHA